MTACEILDTLSLRILEDDRILSPGEKELLVSLLRHARNSVNGCSDKVLETIARAVGEVVAERTYGALGNSIARHLLEDALADQPMRPLQMGTPPVSNPNPGPNDPMNPRPPGPNPPGISAHNYGTRLAGTPPVSNPNPGDPSNPRPPGPNPPGISAHNYGTRLAGTPPVSNPNPGDPSNPRPPGPNPPGVTQPQTNGVAVAEAENPEFLAADCVVLDELLTLAELQALTQYTLRHEPEFRISEVVSPGIPSGAVDYEARRSRVLMDLGPHREVIVDRLRKALPGVLKRLGHDSFDITRVEAQITASNDGDFFHWHTDNGEGDIKHRAITFVYFFHREPKPFRGGELRIYDSEWQRTHYVPMSNYRVIVPEQNQAVLFVSSLTHEITPVEAPSKAFADSRFTVNGWFHR